jgi:adenylate cyclase
LKSRGNEIDVVPTRKNSLESMKLAALQELQDALKIKRINDELLEFLASSLRWLLHFPRKNNLPVPERDRIMDILDRVMAIADKLPPTRNQHDFKHSEDSTEPRLFVRNAISPHFFHKLMKSKTTVTLSTTTISAVVLLLQVLLLEANRH